MLLSSLFVFGYSHYISFPDLAGLASKDIGKKISLSNNVKEIDFDVDIDLSKDYDKGELFRLFKSFLNQNHMFLEDIGNGYVVRKDNYIAEPVTLPELPDIPESSKKHYYMYKIRHITNQDVARVLSIFTDEFGEPIKYVYLKQSDLIAYASTPAMHHKIKKMLALSDNTVLQRMVKITFFSIDDTRLKEYGSEIKALSYGLDFSSENIFGKGRATMNLTDALNFKFLVRALQGRNIANVYQEPKLFLTNGVKTSVSFVKNVGYKESTTVIKDNIQTIQDSIKYRDVGFKLSIIPKIKKDWVYLDLSIVSETLISLKDNIPLTNKVTYQSNVKVYAGKPLLLSGLKKSSERIEKNGVPLLSAVPFLGSLFKNRKDNGSSQTISILIEVL